MADRPVALVGGTIYASPDARPPPAGTAFMENAKLATGSGPPRPPTTETLACTGATVLAGFCNSHVHFFERKWANAAGIPPAELLQQLQGFLTRWGFTTVFDLSSPWVNTRALRDRIEEGEIPGPR